MGTLLGIIIVIVIIFISITFHEAMHAFASYWLGDDTAKLLGRLSLNPIKHIDPFLTIILPIMLALMNAPIFGGAKPVPINFQKVRWGEWGMAIVAIAGPLANLFIAFIVFGIWVLVGTPINGITGQIFVSIISINLGFFIFNLIPIPPLDGSRIIYALAPDFIRKGMENIEKFGIMIVFGVILFAGSAFGSYISTVMHIIINVFENIFRV